MQLRGVITDWGGVMTNPIAETVSAWLATERIDQASYAAVMRRWVTHAYDPDGQQNPIHALERGESSQAEFELALAAELVAEDGGPVASAGLLTRMFAESVLEEAMLDLIRQLRRAGIRTGMLSNSWGGDYPRQLFPELFDAVVISAEVGMRKPEQRIFLLAAERLGLTPAECVFIDDIEANITAAQQVGLTGVLHQDPRETARRVAELVAVPVSLWDGSTPFPP